MEPEKSSDHQRTLGESLRKYEKLSDLVERLSSVEGTLAMGAVIGVSAKLTETPELIVAPLVIDSFFGGIPLGAFGNIETFGRWARGYAAYAAGASLPYIDKVYSVVKDLVDRL